MPLKMPLIDFSNPINQVIIGFVIFYFMWGAIRKWIRGSKLFTSDEPQVFLDKPMNPKKFEEVEDEETCEKGLKEVEKVEESKEKETKPIFDADKEFECSEFE